MTFVFNFYFKIFIFLKSDFENVSSYSPYMLVDGYLFRFTLNI